MCVVSSCAATQAGASAQQQVFTYTVSGQTRSVYYCGTSAAATSSTQVAGFPLCIVS
jgi:predicted secreted Zn-dependent protease